MSFGLFPARKGRWDNFCLQGNLKFLLHSHTALSCIFFFSSFLVHEYKYLTLLTGLLLISFVINPQLKEHMCQDPHGQNLMGSNHCIDLHVHWKKCHMKFCLLGEQDQSCKFFTLKMLQHVKYITGIVKENQEYICNNRYKIFI